MGCGPLSGERQPLVSRGGNAAPGTRAVQPRHRTSWTPVAQLGLPTSRQGMCGGRGAVERTSSVAGGGVKTTRSAHQLRLDFVMGLTVGGVVEDAATAVRRSSQRDSALAEHEHNQSLTAQFLWCVGRLTIRAPLAKIDMAIVADTWRRAFGLRKFRSGGTGVVFAETRARGHRPTED